MSETALMSTDLDRLADRVERAAVLIGQLREKQARLEVERDEMSRRLAELEHQLQGQNAAALIVELAALKKEQREWVGERRDVASRIEALVTKLERLEA